MNRLSGRPSVVKAMLCSLLLHIGAVAASFFEWSKPTNQFSIAGQPKAIYLEVSFSENQPEEWMEVHLEYDPKPAVERIEREPSSTSSTAMDISPRELPLAKRQEVVEIERTMRPELVVDVGERVARVARTRRANESVVMEPKPAELASQPPRHSARPASPRSITVVEQVAGVEDKQQPDFSGNRPPSYPAEAIRRGFEGTVVLRLRIGDTGRVERVEISESSGHPMLDRAAAEAVRSWRGRPARRSGRAAATVELLPVRFRLGR